MKEKIGHFFRSTRTFLHLLAQLCNPREVVPRHKPTLGAAKGEESTEPPQLVANMDKNQESWAQGWAIFLWRKQRLWQGFVVVIWGGRRTSRKWTIWRSALKWDYFLYFGIFTSSWCKARAIHPLLCLTVVLSQCSQTQFTYLFIAWVSKTFDWKDLRKSGAATMSVSKHKDLQTLSKLTLTKRSFATVY